METSSLLVAICETVGIGTCRAALEAAHGAVRLAPREKRSGVVTTRLTSAVVGCTSIRSKQSGPPAQPSVITVGSDLSSSRHILCSIGVDEETRLVMGTRGWVARFRCVCCLHAVVLVG